MEEKYINAIEKNSGKITRLCNNEKGWSVTKDEAIRDIESKKVSYWVKTGSAPRAEIIVYKDDNGQKHLRSSPDCTEENNLENLGPCNSSLL